MTRRQFTLATTIAALITTFVLLPDTARAQSNGYKVGVVDVKQVFDAYKRQTDEYADLQKQRDTKQIEIDKLSESITKQKERYDAESESMSDEARLALQDSIENDYSEYKTEFKRLQESIDRQEKRLLTDLFKQINDAIGEVGTQENYHLILEGGQSGRSGVLYFSTTLNMTQQVIDYLNNKYAES